MPTLIASARNAPNRIPPADFASLLEATNADASPATPAAKAAAARRSRSLRAGQQRGGNRHSSRCRELPLQNRAYRLAQMAEDSGGFVRPGASRQNLKRTRA